MEYNLKITDYTYCKLDKYILQYIETYSIKHSEVNCCHFITIQFLEYTESEVCHFYFILNMIYNTAPQEPNVIYAYKRKIKLNDNQSIKQIFWDIRECTPKMFVSAHLLCDIVKNNANIIKKNNDLIKLGDIPFSGIFKIDNLDLHFDLYAYIHPRDNLPDNLTIENGTIIVSNRIIQIDFKFNKCPSISFNNCIFENNVKFSNCEELIFWNCIFMEEVECVNISSIKILETNIKFLFIYNSSNLNLNFNFSKIYRFEFIFCHIEKMLITNNKIIEIYFAQLHMPKNKIDMSQFVEKNVNFKTIHKEKNKIKCPDDFLISFQVHQPLKNVLKSDIALDNINILLNSGEFGTNNNELANLKYKKLLYSNKGIKKMFVFITGGFLKPVLWIYYLVAITVIFAGIYCMPFSQFELKSSSEVINIDLWTALHYSILMIIGSNTTDYFPKGCSQICTTLQSVLCTVVIANFFTSVIKKYMNNS